MGVAWRNPGGTIPWLLGGRAGVRAGGQEAEGCCTVLPWVPAEADVGQGPGMCWCSLKAGKSAHTMFPSVLSRDGAQKMLSGASDP